MAERIKLEEQKAVQKNVFAFNISAPSPWWPGIGHKIPAVSLPHAVVASTEDDSSLLLSLPLLAKVANLHQCND